MGYLAVAVVLVGIGLFTWKLTRAGYESAEYTVLEADGSFEIRQYPDLMLASTGMRLQSQGGDGSFMRLFGYISGGNETEEKVAMTTPVFMEGNRDESNGQMAFVIPQNVVSAGVPDPTAADVQIREREGGRFAVIRFSGKINAETSAAAEKSLRKWIEQKGLTGEDAMETAGYDPPFTPGLLRRNEVLIRLAQ